MSRPRTFCQIRPITEEEAKEAKNSYKGSLKPDYQIDIPKHTNCKKEFPTKTKKPMLFHERGHLIADLDRKKIEEIPTKQQDIMFFNILNQFKTVEELRNLEITDVFDVDADLLTELQQKCVEFIDVTSYLADEKEKSGKLEEAQSDQMLLNYLTEKLAEMKNNEINLKIAINNIENIKSLSYSTNGVKIYFRSGNGDF